MGLGVAFHRIQGHIQHKALGGAIMCEQLVGGRSPYASVLAGSSCKCTCTEVCWLALGCCVDCLVSLQPLQRFLG